MRGRGSPGASLGAAAEDCGAEFDFWRANGAACAALLPDLLVLGIRPADSRIDIKAKKERISAKVKFSEKLNYCHFPLAITTYIRRTCLSFVFNIIPVANNPPPPHTPWIQCTIHFVLKWSYLYYTHSSGTMNVHITIFNLPFIYFHLSILNKMYYFIIIDSVLE